MHDALVRAYEKRASFQSGRNLRAWLLSILHNVFIDGRRARQAETQRIAQAAELQEPFLAPVQDHPQATSGRISRVRYGSISRGRRRALFWSYFFLIGFVIFFLTPPVYMFITSLKSSAEIPAATNRWWVFYPTLSNYIDLLSENQYLIFFRNSAIVSVAVVAVTMVISILAAFALARMRFWGSATLATGVFLTYLIPAELLFIPLFKTFAFIHDTTGVELINHWWVLIIFTLL